MEKQVNEQEEVKSIEKIEKGNNVMCMFLLLQS